MYKLFFTTVFFCCTFFAGAQIIIKGKVIDDATGLPVINASVYLNNTSIGTITSGSGEFVLTAGSIYTGELIISSVGYQPLSYQLDNTTAAQHFFTFRLAVKEKLLKDVLIISDATRTAWLKLFKENFLGITEEGDNCKIENISQVYFTNGKDKNIIYAYADTPLVIINKLLGYKISFDLIEFNYNRETGGTYFVGYNRYEETGTAKRFIKRRKQSYFGSTMHFYRSLIANDLAASGYIVYELRRLQGSFDSVIKEKQPAIKKQDTALLAYPVSTDKILYADSIAGGYYLHAVNNQLMVRYKKVPASRNYLANKSFLQGIDHYGSSSYINLRNNKVELDKNGIIKNPLEVIYNGFWVYEKLGNQLPFNYIPD